MVTLGNSTRLAGRRVPTHLHHVDHVIGHPEAAEGHHDAQDQLLAAHRAAELGLLQASHDQHIAGHDDGVREYEASHRLKGILEPHLNTGDGDNTHAHTVSTDNYDVLCLIIYH